MSVVPKQDLKSAQNPDTVRAPDAAFVRQAAIDERGISKGYWEGAPDLAVEVISPGDTYTEVAEKVDEWLNAGVRDGVGRQSTPRNCRSVPVP